MFPLGPIPSPSNGLLIQFSVPELKSLLWSRLQFQPESALLLPLLYRVHLNWQAGIVGSKVHHSVRVCVPLLASGGLAPL